MTERPVGFGRREAAGSGGTGAPDVVPGAVTLDDAAASALLPDRPARGHKGDFGKLLVIAGSLDYAGAALLVCRAAGRAGAGLVTLAVPESLQPLFAAKVVEATTMALPEDDVEEIDPEPALARILEGTGWSLRDQTPTTPRWGPDRGSGRAWRQPSSCAS